MEISERRAAAILGGPGAGLHRPEAMRVLHAGFAGPRRPVGGGDRRAGKVLYDEERVRDLLEWPVAWAEEPLTYTSAGALVLRAGPRRPDPRSPVGWSGVDLGAPINDQRSALSRTRAFAMSAYAVLAISRAVTPRTPVVVTVSGYVALGADLLAVKQAEGARTCELELGPPGAWFGPFDRTRLRSTPGAERRWLALP